jgi:LacI family transcriptional regulator, galactose operon repressor
MNTVKVKKRVTIAMVAKQANVSRAAVYAVLNSHKGMNIGVGEHKRKKIYQAIHSLGYIPNESARTLVTGKSRSVGILVPSWGENNMPQLLNEIIEQCNNNGFSVLPELSHGNPETEFKKLRSLYSQNVAALIISRYAPGVNDDILNHFVETGVTVIVLGADDLTNDNFHCVTFNEQAVMELISDFLLKTGCCRIAYLRNNRYFPHSLFMRKKYLFDALQSKGENLHGDYNISNYQECSELVETLMKNKKRPDAMICYNDQTAKVFINCLMAQGYRVPEDIAVVGVDGLDDPFQPVPLTTVKLPFTEMGDTCWKIIDSVVNKNINSSLRLHSLSPKLIIRDSTKGA